MLIAIAVIALTIPAPVFAESNSEDTNKNDLVERVSRTVDDTVTTTKESETESVDDKTDSTRVAVFSREDQISSKKTELKEKLAQRLEDRKSKLEGRRLAKCENRQVAINKLIEKSAATGQAKFDRIKAFKEGIVGFYTDNSLNSDQYESLLADVESKEADAQAALETMADQTFECSLVDGTDPSATIKQVHESKRESLKDYRDSVQALLVDVRTAFAQTKETQDETQ